MVDENVVAQANRRPFPTIFTFCFVLVLVVVTYDGGPLLGHLRLEHREDRAAAAAAPEEGRGPSQPEGPARDVEGPQQRGHEGTRLVVVLNAGPACCLAAATSFSLRLPPPPPSSVGAATSPNAARVEGRREVRSLRARSLYAMRVGRPTLSTAQVCTSPRARSC